MSNKKENNVDMNVLPVVAEETAVEGTNEIVVVDDGGNEDVSKDCPIVQDLLPLYIDGIVKEETKEFVEEHLSDCKDCVKELVSLKAPITVEKKQEEEIDAKKVKKGIAHFKRKQSVKACGILIVIILFISTSRNMIRKYEFNKLTLGTWGVGNQRVLCFDDSNQVIFGDGFDQLIYAGIADGDEFRWEGYGFFSVSWDLLDGGNIRVNKENHSMEMEFKFRHGQLVIEVCGEEVCKLDKM